MGGAEPDSTRNLKHALHTGNDGKGVYKGRTEEVEEVDNDRMGGCCREFGDVNERNCASSSILQGGNDGSRQEIFDGSDMTVWDGRKVMIMMTEMMRW